MSALVNSEGSFGMSRLFPEIENDWNDPSLFGINGYPSGCVNVAIRTYGWIMILAHGTRKASDR